MPACCAACGKSGDTLQKCSACKSVKYCNVTCQKAHRKNHKKECRKRTAQLFDEALFKQPPRGDECPICFLLLPRVGEVVYYPCCGKNICNGCVQQMAVDTNKCPFCREPVADSHKEWVARCNKRMEAGDANAFNNLGLKYFRGRDGLPKDQKKGLALWLRAAELGSAEGHCNVANIYNTGEVVEGDLGKAVYHWEQAAMLRNCMARHNLGSYEAGKGNMKRAIKHWIIAAGTGHKKSLDTVRRSLMNESATKADYEKALRDYQNWLDEVSSDQRDRAALGVAV